MADQTNVLTVEEVNQRVEAIKQIVAEEHPVVAGEKGHKDQDKLVSEVLEAIANGAEDPVGLATAALEVYKIEFTRWFG